MVDDFIILNDGTVIDTARTLETYLDSLGLDKDTLRRVLFGEEMESIESLEDCCREQELIADQYCNALMSAQSEIEDLADELASGRGGTKVAYAAKFKQVMDYYCQ